LASTDLTFLRLLQLADSALPIGMTSHSFGLETLAADGALHPYNLEDFMVGVLEESARLEAVFCREAWVLGTNGFDELRWRELNARLSAIRIARETRQGSLALGRRFLQLAASLDVGVPATEGHVCCAFGLTAGVLGIPSEDAILAYLHQSVAGLISACQRLMPLGQTRAAQISWELKAAVAQVVREMAGCSLDDATCFAASIDLASMRHPNLSTRLFVS